MRDDIYFEAAAAASVEETRCLRSSVRAAAEAQCRYIFAFSRFDDAMKILRSRARYAF